VWFPAHLEPFGAQRATMAKAITALKLGENALLESPTGTGKTLALLSSALAYQSQERHRRALVWAAASEAAKAAVVGSGGAAAGSGGAPAEQASTLPPRPPPGPRIFHS